MLRTRWLVAPLALVLIGCGEEEQAPSATGPIGKAPAPLTSVDVTTRSDAIVERLVNVGLGSQTTLRNSNAWGAVDGLLDAMGAFGGSGEDAVPPVPPEPVPPQASEDPPIESEEADPEEIAAELNTWLGENVFNDDNLESSTGVSATFLLAGETLCGTIYVCEPCLPEEPYCDPACTEQVDQDCMTLVDDAQIRIRATLVGEDGLEVALMIGPARISPVSATLSPNRVTTELDLGQAKAAVEFLLTLSEEDLEIVPRVMQGRLRAELTLTGDESFSASYAVTQAVLVEVDTEEGTFKVAVEAANPLTSLIIDGALGMLALDLDLRAVDVTVPWAAFTEAENSVGNLLFHLAGLSFGVSLTDEDDSLTVDTIGLGNGSSWVKKDGLTLFNLDLNASAGRTFDLNVDPSGAELLFAVAPELDLVAAFELLSIVDEVPEIESFLLDETYRLRLWGSGGASVMPVADAELLRVVSGTLEISSTAATAPVTVHAGQCLSFLDEADAAPGSHAILGLLAAVVCP